MVLNLIFSLSRFTCRGFLRAGMTLYEHLKVEPEQVLLALVLREVLAPTSMPSTEYPYEHIQAYFPHFISILKCMF